MDPAAADATAAASGVSDATFGLSMMLIVMGLYFLPAIISVIRKHHNRMQIILLNLLLGWTFLGWIGALIWSAGTVKRPGTAGAT
jgi:hypothetical protein